MKFPKLFGKKTAQTDEDLDDDDLDGVVREDATDASDGEPGGDGMDDEDDELDALEGPKGGRRRKTMILVIAAVSLVVLAAGGGAAWWLMGDDTPAEAKAKAPEPPPPGVVVLDIPPRPGEKRTAADPSQAKTATDTLNALAAMTDGPGAGVVVAPVQPAAFAGIAVPKASTSLTAAPDPALAEQGGLGPLPKIGADGRKAWTVYARPFTATDKKPRVAVVVAGLGMSRDATEGAIRLLPGGITLALDPYGNGLADWAAKARQAGHELLVGLPMESAAFPAQDPGRYALMTAASPTDNLQRLEYVLSRFSGYVGVLTMMGSQFTLEEAQMKPMLDAINRRGLLYVDAMATRNTVGPATAQNMGLPRGFIDLQIDDNPSKAAIGKRLSELEDLARKHGTAIAIAQPLPVTIERLAAWAASLDGRGLALAPVSAAIDRQPLR